MFLSGWNIRLLCRGCLHGAEERIIPFVPCGVLEVEAKVEGQRRVPLCVPGVGVRGSLIDGEARLFLLCLSGPASPPCPQHYSNTFIQDNSVNSAPFTASQYHSIIHSITKHTIPLQAPQHHLFTGHHQTISPTALQPNLNIQHCIYP